MSKKTPKKNAVGAAARPATAVTGAERAVARTGEDATTCSECDETIPARAGRGRSRRTCSQSCRDRRSRRLRAEREGRQARTSDEVTEVARLRRALVLARYRELEAEGATRPGATVAAELGLSRQRVHQIVSAARADALAGGGSRGRGR